jgi:hypothetical protein
MLTYYKVHNGKSIVHPNGHEGSEWEQRYGFAPLTSALGGGG